MDTVMKRVITDILKGVIGIVCSPLLLVGLILWVFLVEVPRLFWELFETIGDD